MKITGRSNANSKAAASAPAESSVRRSTFADPLDALFNPRSIALIGASERSGSVGRTVMSNLLATPFGGCVYPVNAKRRSVMGVAAAQTLAELPEVPDLGVVVTPAPAVPQVVEELAELCVPAAVIISAGFAELGPEGVALETQIMRTARASGMRIVGPNCLGVMNPLTGMNVTFANGIAQPGNVAFLSQSGALCTSILDWSLQENVGFSSFVSLGSMLDVGWGDLIDHFGRDPNTSSILLYLETVGDARSFLSAAREVALKKPIIAIKGGRTEESRRAAASHTGALAGSDMVFDAALRRVGVLRVDTIAELFSMAGVLAKQPRPKGKRLTIVTNAGGPGVLATDALVQGGGELSSVSPEVEQSLNEVLPAQWSHSNPIDVLGDADAGRYARTLDIVANDPDSDGLLIVLTPQDMTDPLKIAETLGVAAKIKDKPVLASFMGGQSIQEAVRLLNDAGIPNFLFPDEAARAFNYLWRYADNLRNIYETPWLVSDGADRVSERKNAVSDIIANARSAGRTLLTEDESKRVMSAYDLPVVPTYIAETEDEAVALARQIRFPVVLKLHSHSITHKTDVGGVQLNLPDATAVRRAYRVMETSVRERAGEGHFGGVTVQPMITMDGYEIILGSSMDSQFGPIILFGTGGELVEIYRDHAIALPPLNATLAHRVMGETRIYSALQGTRGKATVDMKQLETTLVNFSRLLVEQPLIKESDINPLLVSSDGVLALDARIVLHEPLLQHQDIPQTAIRPYPAQYVKRARLTDNRGVKLRPIRLEDEPLMVKFHGSLSEQSVRRRYFQLIHLDHRTDHNRLVQVCYDDYDNDVAIVAEIDDEENERAIMGVGRLSRKRSRRSAEFSVIVGDPWQHRGLGTLLLTHLIEIGRREHIQRIVGHILPENRAMQSVCKRLGFRIRRHRCDDEVLAIWDPPSTDRVA